MPTRRSLLVLAATVALVVAGPVCARDKSIVVASTTSTQDSGLFGHILPLARSVNDSLSMRMLFKEIVNSALSKPFPSALLESKSSTKAPPFCVKLALS